MIPGTTIDGLLSEANERWGDIYDPETLRMQVMIICPRKERKIIEMHGDMVEHGQPVIGVFHRPRAEARLLEEQGLNPRDASFQFLDLATSDLGPWMKHMVTSEKWIRGSISVQPVPFSVDVPAQRAFENITMICFRHPSLPAIERYYLPFPPTSIPNKCFVSLPRRQAAELARKQAEVLGVGRAAEPATPEPVVVEEQTPEEVVAAPASTEVEVSEVTIPTQKSVPLPTIESDEPEGPQSVSEAITKATTDGFEEMQAAGDELMEMSIPLPHQSLRKNQNMFQNPLMNSHKLKSKSNSEPWSMNCSKMALSPVIWSTILVGSRSMNVPPQLDLKRGRCSWNSLQLNERFKLEDG